ncbi:MAG: hypothetical protein JXR05_13820 [Flavobacteriaceae bacterium]
MEEKGKPTQTPAFAITIIILLIVFIIFMVKSPLYEKYDFWPFVGIGAGSVFIGIIIYMLAYGIVESIFKIIVEVIAAILIFINVIYLVHSWETFELMKYSVYELGILRSWNQNFVTVLAILIPMLIVNIVAFFIIYPLSRIAGTRVDLD